MSKELVQIRVRKIINYLNTDTHGKLKKLLPVGVLKDQTIKDIPNVKYPTGILGCLPKEESYSTLGRIAEDMLHYAAKDINLTNLLIVCAHHYPGLSESDKAKITKSITTAHFIERLVATRQQLEADFVGTPVFEPTVGRLHVQGHPDIKTPTQVYEVKLTGQVQENWTEFCFQAFAYAALDPAVTAVNIVLPLQNLVWSYDVGNGWPKREEYFALLERLAVELQTVAADNGVVAQRLIAEHCIGTHISKSPGPFLKSIQHIKDGSVPYQLFLSSNMSSRVTIKEEEIEPVAAHIRATGARVFIHSPYIINLCAPEGEDDDYHTNCLIAITRIAARMGLAGVVVHVGKTTTRDPKVAMANMKANLLRAAGAAATPTCPILLETPAGQGTETLTGFHEFFDFVEGLKDDRIGVCVDTCHVFACGHNPISYLNCAIGNWPGLVRLVHYNDSMVECGARVDRHAFMGMGKIGLKTMETIAQICTDAHIPAIIE